MSILYKIEPGDASTVEKNKESHVLLQEKVIDLDVSCEVIHVILAGQQLFIGAWTRPALFWRTSVLHPFVSQVPARHASQV